MKTKKLKYFIGILVFGFFCFLKTENSYATDKITISSKAALEGVYQCLYNGAFSGMWNASNVNNFILSKLGGDTVKLPYGWTDVDDNNMDCNQLMFGFSSAGVGGEKNITLQNGLLPDTVQKGTSNTVKNFFAGSDGKGGDGSMNYGAETAGNVGSEQATSKLTLSSTLEGEQCLNSDGTRANNTELTFTFPTITKDNSGNWFFGDVAVGNDEYNAPTPGSGDMVQKTFCGQSLVMLRDEGSSKSPYYTMDVFYTNYYKNEYDQLTSNTTQTQYTIQATSDGWWVSNGGDWFESQIESGTVANSSDFDDWTLEYNGDNTMIMINTLNSKNGAGVSVKNLTDNYSSLAFTEQEIYDLYTYYINDVYQIPIICEGEANYDLYTDQPEINWKSGTTCHAYTGSPNANNSVSNLYGVEKNSAGFYHFTATISGYDDVISVLGELNLSTISNTQESGTLESGGTSSGETSSGDGKSETSAEEDPCWNAGIDSMAWILCPAESNLESTASWLDNTVQDWLEVDVAIYDNGKLSYDDDGQYVSGSATYMVWETMRNVANVAMIIIILIVVISQLTGVGIDNYGIKKLLPKFIVMAILINFSFLICEIAVDLSNLLGVGLRDLFKNLGPKITEAGGTDWGELTIATLISSIFATAGVAGAAAPVGMSVVTAFASGGGTMVVVVIILALLSILLAVLMFFLALGGRLLIIIICMAIAPLAFVCYILPNTKKFFSKWWQLFESALVIFPICGALSGISYLLKSIILATNEVHLWMLIIALVAPYLVFFLLPSLLKKSIAGLGVIGGALTTMGDKFKSGVGKGADTIKSTDRYKEASEFGQRNLKSRMAENYWRRHKDEKPGDLNAYQRMRRLSIQRKLEQYKGLYADEKAGMAIADDQVYDDRAEARRNAAEVKNFQDQYANISTKGEMSNTLEAALKSGNSSSISAAIAAAEQRGMQDVIYKQLAQNGDVVKNDARVLAQLASSKNKILKSYGKLGAGKSYNEFVRGNGSDGGTLAHYINQKGDEFLESIDDKTLQELSRISTGDEDHGIPGATHLSADQLLKAAASTSNQESITFINQMLAKKDISEVSTIGAGTLANLRADTIRQLNSNGGNDKLRKAYTELLAANNSQLLANMDGTARKELETIFNNSSSGSTA